MPKFLTIFRHLGAFVFDFMVIPNFLEDPIKRKRIDLEDLIFAGSLNLLFYCLFLLFFDFLNSWV